MAQQDLEAVAPLLMDRSRSRSVEPSGRRDLEGGLGLSGQGVSHVGAGRSVIDGWEREESGEGGQPTMDALWEETASPQSSSGNRLAS